MSHLCPSFTHKHPLLSSSRTPRRRRSGCGFSVLIISCTSLRPSSCTINGGCGEGAEPRGGARSPLRSNAAQSCFCRPASLRAQVWHILGCGDLAMGDGNGSTTLRETSWPRSTLSWLSLCRCCCDPAHMELSQRLLGYEMRLLRRLSHTSGSPLQTRGTKTACSCSLWWGHLDLTHRKFSELLGCGHSNCGAFRETSPFLAHVC